MKKEDLAQLLNGRQYYLEMTPREEKLAKDNNLLVCFGNSDDLLELRGIIYDEVDACKGGTASIVLKKENKLGLMNGCDLESIKDLFEENDLAFNLPIVEIEAVWCPVELNDLKASWLIKSKIPSASFDIMEDDILYCRGLVIERADIEKELRK